MRLVLGELLLCGLSDDGNDRLSRRDRSGKVFEKMTLKSHGGSIKSHRWCIDLVARRT